MPKKIEPPTPDQQSWIDEQLDAARKFFDAFSGENAGEPIMLPGLDRAFTAWLETTETAAGKGSPNLSPSQPAACSAETVPDTFSAFSTRAAIDAVGVAFGQILINALDLRWVLFTDEEGSQLAVHGLPGEGDVLVFPQDFVAKQYKKGKTGFLHPSYQNIARHIKLLRQARSG